MTPKVFLKTRPKAARRHFDLKTVVAAFLLSLAVVGRGDTLARTNWYDSGDLLTATPGHLTFVLTNHEQMWTTYFAPSNQPLVLAQPGSQLKLIWTFTPTGIRSGSTTHRLHMVVADTPDTHRLTADGMPATDVAYTGYGTFTEFDEGYSLFFYNVLLGVRPSPVSAYGLLPTTGLPEPQDIASVGWLGMASTGSGAGCPEGSPLTLTFSLTRNATNGIDYSTVMAGDAGTYFQAGFTDPAPAAYAFNTFCLADDQYNGSGTAMLDTTGFKAELGSTSTALVKDTWADADRTDPAAPVYSEDGTDADRDGDIESAWFNSPGSSMTVTPGHLITTITNGETYWTTYITPSNAPVTLAHTGDRIKVTWAFTPSDVHGGSTGTPLHVALVNTQGTNRLTADAALTDAAYGGYAAFIGDGNDDLFWNLTLAGRSDPLTVSPLFQTGYFQQFSGWTPFAGNVKYNAGANDHPYVFEMSLTRNADSGLDVTAAITETNGTVVNAAAGTDAAPNTFTYDAVTLWNDGTTSGTFDTTLFEVQVFPVPVLQPVIQSSNGLIEFNWNARTNLTYQLQYSTSLTNWLNLGNPITATNATAGVSDLIGTNAQRFYRVMLLP